MKPGLGLYRQMLTPQNFRFARQAGAQAIVAHLVDSMPEGPRIPDAKTVKGKVSLLGIQSSAQPQVLYAAAAVKSSKHLQAAKAWVKHLRRKSVQKQLRAAGFLPIPH